MQSWMNWCIHQSDATDNFKHDLQGQKAVPNVDLTVNSEVQMWGKESSTPSINESSNLPHYV